MGRSATADEKKKYTLTAIIAQAFGLRYARSSVISSASLAILSLFYVYTVASYVELTVYPLQDRVTYIATFARYITTSEYADHVIMGSLFIVWLWFTLASSAKNPKVHHAIVGAFAALYAVAAAVNYQPAVEGIALASLPTILLLAIYNRYYSSSQRKILSDTASLDLTLNYFAIIGTAIGIIGITLALVPIFSNTTTTAAETGQSLLAGTLTIHNYGYDLYLALSSTFAPALLMLLIASVPVKLLSDRILKPLKVRHAFSNLDSSNRDTPFAFPPPPIHIINANYRILYLALIALLSILLVIIPHLPTINPDGQQIGVDTGYYVNWVRDLQSSTDMGDLFYQAFVVQNQGDRPLFLLFLYALNEVSPAESLFITAEFVPLILAPALVLTTFFLTREMTSHDIASLFAAFVTAVSFQTLIGIYAGFYANWMALILGYLSLIFLFRFLKQQNIGEGRRSSSNDITNLTLFGSLMLLTLFTHVYTWSILSIAAGILLLVGIVRPRSTLLPHIERKNAALLMTVLLSVVAIDIARTALIGSSGGIESDLEVAERLVGPDQFGWRWYNLSYTTVTFVGGVFANFLVLGLGLYWLVRTRIQGPVAVFIIIFFSLGVLPYVVGEWIVQTRVFYNVPFQIPAGIALAFILQGGSKRKAAVAAGETEGSGKGREREGEREEREGTIKRRRRLIRIIPICTLLILAAIYYASNFYFIAPGTMIPPDQQPPLEIPLG